MKTKSWVVNCALQISLCLLSPQGGSEQQQQSTVLYIGSRAGFMEMVFFFHHCPHLLHN
jgi:hypothetical protein